MNYIRKKMVEVIQFFAKKLFICLNFLLIPLCVQATPYPFFYTNLNHRLPANSQWALAVTDCTTGATNGIGVVDMPLTPASTLKLLTTGAALADGLTGWRGAELLSEKQLDGGILTGNLYLRGTGNTLLTSNDLSKAVDELHRMQRIDGDLIVDATFFQSNALPRDRRGPSYAPPGALGLDLHTIAVIAEPDVPGQPPRMRVEPSNAVQFAITARTTSSGPTTLRIEQLDDFSYKVSGNLPVAAGLFKQRFALNNPARYAGETLRTLLSVAGIKLSGQVGEGESPSKAKVLVNIAGPLLPELLREMNTYSLNVVADNLFLLLGARKYGAPGTKSKGIKALIDHLSDLRIPTSQVSILDGSGLDKDNKISVNVMAHYLATLSKGGAYGNVRASLPRSGYEGTVKHLTFKDERFLVKSGKLEDVYALAGYGVDVAGHNVAFAFIVNGTGAGILSHMDAIGADVLRFIAQGAVQ